MSFIVAHYTTFHSVKPLTILPMKKILLILNGTLTPPHIMEAAINLAYSTSSLLHAVFIDYELDLAEYNYFFPNDLALTRNNLTGKNIAEENAALIDANIQLFEDECERSKVNYYVEKGKSITLGDLLNYSIFSDIIMADANEDLREHHITDLLVKAHCPVYLISKHVPAPENIILTYDGSASSVYSIKLYSYLFPEFRSLPTQLVFINSEKKEQLPQEQNIKRWLTTHFSNLHIKVIHGDVSGELVNYVKTISNPLTVMGSFGRSLMARIFHKSPANEVIEKARSSVFITHEQH